MARYPSYVSAQRDELPTVRSEVKGELSLQLPEELASKIAVAVAQQFSPEPTPDGPESVGQVHWWWEPITSKEAADFLKTSTSTLSKLRGEGRIPVNDALSPRMPRFFRAQLIAWQLGLPIPAPPWTISNPFSWRWLPLTDREACEFLSCETADLETWIDSFDLPVHDHHGRRSYFRAQLLAWVMGKPIPDEPEWEAWDAAIAKYNL